jgi:uncharacterized protein (TIGR03000 family)
MIAASRTRVLLLGVGGLLALAASATPRASGDTPATGDARAEITVLVPAAAVVSFFDQPTRQQGTERVFVTPPLKAGTEYYYDVSARWTASGKEVTQTRKLTVTAGARVRVDFRTPSPQTARTPSPQTTAKLSEEEVVKLGMGAYFYGLPIVLMDVTKDVMTAVPAPNAEGTAAPVNQFAKMPGYVSPDFKTVVRVSLNSLWSTAWLDLGPEPVVLTVPNTKDRYYVMSVMSMWTNVFGSMGKRATGTGAGNFLIVGPDWKGTPPPDIKETYRSPTRLAWLLGQTQANGPMDLAAVNAIQKDYKLTPLSAWGKAYTPPADAPVNRNVDTKATPIDQILQMDAGTFFNRLALLMKDNPPAAEDAPVLQALQMLGIEPGKSFDIRAVDPVIASGLKRAVKGAPAAMQAGAAKLKTINGWLVPMNLGRYGTDYATRAFVAYMGLGADIAEDTLYPTAYVDGEGKPLDSANKYVLHFEKGQLPPTNGTWSVSQYKGNFYERNALNRYAIAPWMPLKFNADGSLDIYLQAESPGPDKEANWLPTPPGQFNITVRNYWPAEAALDGSYKIPGIKRVN